MAFSEVNSLIGVQVFFLLLASVVVALRLCVRLRIKKAAFGLDDVFLTISYVCGIVVHSFS